MSQLRSLKLTGLALAATAWSISIAGVAAQSDGADIGKLAGSLFTNPAALFIFILQLFLGIGLGYVSLKALKYLLALAALTVLGMVLNVWQAPRLGIDFLEVYEVIVKFAYAFGLITILHLTVGFIVGALVGALK